MRLLKLSVFVKVCFIYSASLTLDGPLKEGLTSFTRGHTIVVARRHVTTH